MKAVSTMYGRPWLSMGVRSSGHVVWLSQKSRNLTTSSCLLRQREVHDPRLKESSDGSKEPHSPEGTKISGRDGDNIIHDQFSVLRSSYRVPKYPIILAHGLLGFDELRIAGPNMPGIEYWYGIRDALAARDIQVMTATVPPSGSIEARAQKLSEDIERKAGGREVNIIAGLDSRYMISQLKPPNVIVKSLTTISTPHRGSAFADYMFKSIGMTNIPKLYHALEFFGLETGAFEQLTQEYMTNSFNPRTPDLEGVKYYSYGALLRPTLTSVFRKSHQIVDSIEGPNDGLVSVASSKWGTYCGTLDNVSHLDLINWTNRLRWYFWEVTGHKRNFNAIAFYLGISDMLAKEGL
ncbi:alpha/beta-hydrolase [Hortaea werneckii]|nr:alpha/beta-hydrolase [Hortaea werneckii]